jgi:hypothetical protein
MVELTQTALALCRDLSRARPTSPGRRPSSWVTTGVEALVVEVEVDRPLVDQVRPGLDPLAYLGRDQVLVGDHEVREHHARLVTVAAEVEVDVRELEEPSRILLVTRTPPCHAGRMNAASRAV